jgi:hypothetical protein
MIWRVMIRHQIANTRLRQRESVLTPATVAPDLFKYYYQDNKNTVGRSAENPL